MKPLRKQSGIALLSVMLVLTLMVLIAADVTFAFRLQMRRNATQQQMEQARWYALSAEELAIKVLKDDLDNSDTVHLDQNWATGGVSFPVEQGMISGYAADRQACLNLNAMDKPDAEDGTAPVELRVFKNLLESLSADSLQAEIIVQSTRDWVSKDDRKASSHGADDSDYLTRPVPYLAANTAMRDTSEWRAVNGVSATIARKVMPFLCVIPEKSLQINVNTLHEDQPELLAALFVGDLPVEQARDVLSQRSGEGWESVDAFLSEPLLANFSSSTARPLMSTNSQYFEVNAKAVFADSESRLSSLLRRTANNEFHVIRRQHGGYQ